MTADEAVAKLDDISGQEPDGDHGRADDILLECVSPRVKAAYERLIERARWWATA